jgi:endoglucanase
VCYVDHIESWSTNEITINWNAALSQMAGWLAVHGPLSGG